MRHRALSFVAILALAPLAAGAGEPFAVDVDHSSVGFSVTHMAVSKVRGAFLDYAATADVDMEDFSASSVEVTIEATSVDTRNEQRDGHLRSADFFDVENHPQITFVSTAIEGEGSELVAVGDLTIRGVTQSVRMPVTVTGPVQDPWGNTRLGVSGRLTIDRTEFGLSYNRVLETGGLVVGKEVDIQIDIELVKSSG